MRTEQEVKNKIEHMFNMLDNVRKDAGTPTADRLSSDLQNQIDMLLWVLEDESGLPPLDEDETYSCYSVSGAGYYGVSQSCHGHEYVSIFDEESLRKATDKADGIIAAAKESGSYCEDIGWPIGGSNSSATYIVSLKDMDDVKTFLADTCDGPDLEDPELVDIAEYIRSVDAGEGITQECLDKLGLKAADLDRLDCRYDELISLGFKPEDFYGEYRGMRYSEAKRKGGNLKC